jgi:hypothetical protein
MVGLLDEDPRPYQPPTLNVLEESGAGFEMARQVTLESLMASEDMPDIEVLQAVFNGPGGSCPIGDDVQLSGVSWNGGE